VKKRIFINMASNNLGRFFEMALGLLLIPFLIRKLGIKGFGLVVLMESLIGFFTLASSGLRSALGRYIGISIFRKNKQDIHEYIATGEMILLLIVPVVLIAGFFLQRYFFVLFNVPDAFRGDMRNFIAIMIFTFIFQIAFLARWSILYSFQRFDLMNIYTGVRNIIRCALCFLIYSIFGPKLQYYGYIYLLAAAAEQILANRSAVKLFPARTLQVKYISYPKMKQLFSFMVHRTINSVSGLLYEDTDMLLINRFLGPAYNTVYSIALKFGDILKRLVQKSLWVMVPTFTELAAKKKYREIEKLYVSTTKIASILSIPICVIGILFGKELIRLWVGESFDGAATVMYVNIIATVPIIIFGATSGVTISHAKIKLPNIITISCAVINVFMSLLFAIKLNMGLVGFALGTVTAVFIQQVIFNPYYACKVADIDPVMFYRGSFLKPLVLNILFGGGMYYLKVHAGLPMHYLLVCLVLLILPYVFLCYFFILNDEEKKYWRSSGRGADHWGEHC